MKGYLLKQFLRKKNRNFIPKPLPTGSHSQHLGGDLQRRHRGSVFLQTHPEEAVHRHRQEVAHSARIEGRDGGRGHHLRQALQGRHLHQHPRLQQRRLLARQDRHRRSQAAAI